MSDRKKNLVVTILFSLFVSIFFLLNVILADQEVSLSERRKLKQFPDLSVKTILNTSFMTDFDKYTLDQFPFREKFRELKAFVQFNLLNQKDNNKIYVVGDFISKIEYPLKESSIQTAAEKLNSLYEKYLKGMKVHYSIIPDKNYFLAKENGYPMMDYDKLVEIMNQNIKDMTYIHIFDCLQLEDYYKTDTHWSQDKIQEVVERISKEMGFAERLSNNYEERIIKDFYGVYYGQAALNLKPDVLKYLTNETIENSVVYNYENGALTTVYDLAKLEGMDKYDIFLSGATPLLKITNPNATTEKELIVFRDSFGSSLIPLLIEGYKTITVVDIRYMPSDLLPEYIEFADQDVLFLYSTLVLNDATMLR